jgi:hypothetical protein
VLSELEIPSSSASEPVECSSSAGTGEITGVTTGVASIVYSGCEFYGEPCQNASSGVVQTNPLQTTLGFAGFELTSTTGVIVEFKCNVGVEFRIIGHMLGLLSELQGDEMRHSEDYGFYAESPASPLVAEIRGYGSPWSGPWPMSYETADSHESFVSEVEIMEGERTREAMTDGGRRGRRHDG